MQIAVNIFLDGKSLIAQLLQLETEVFDFFQQGNIVALRAKVACKFADGGKFLRVDTFVHKHGNAFARVNLVSALGKKQHNALEPDAEPACGHVGTDHFAYHLVVATAGTQLSTQPG